ncbi:hypothetical protein [Azohydromonas aeria]|uniref:hypothetical protein n=1 Tax=Azohydromonas aeria TaxID=2590212 RepID=UPI0012FA908C|nr:hypothetical protein [Azohydromonas aeria]
MNALQRDAMLAPGLALLRRARRDGERSLLYFYVVAAALSVWIAHYPPLGDVPQHAAQVALALDLLQGQSRWDQVVTFNFFTPYLIGYGLMGLFAQVMSMASAVKLVLSLSVLGFFWAASTLRRRFEAPAFLDWLLLAGFFGFAFKWGFVTFLLAAPIGIFFILKSLDFVEDSSIRRGMVLALIGVLLFFSHGLVFVACVGIGFCYAVLGISSWRMAVVRLLPFVMLGILTLIYLRFSRDVAAQTTEAQPFVLEWTPRRVVRFFRYQWDTALRARLMPGYVLNCLAYALFYLTPFLMGMRLRLTLRRAIPFAVMLVIGMVAPHTAMTTGFIYERFALFLMPFYVLLFAPADGPLPAWHERMRLLVLLAVPTILLAMTASRSWGYFKFNREIRDFREVMSVIPPQQRVLSLIMDKYSRAADNPHTYLHFPAWYQAEKRGFVDANFAQWLPQIVRFRPGEARVQSPFEWKPYRFDWVKHRGEQYDYFVFRSVSRMFPTFQGVPCEIRLVASAGPWAVYHRRPDSCTTAPSGGAGVKQVQGAPAAAPDPQRAAVPAGAGERLRGSAADGVALPGSAQAAIAWAASRTSSGPR